MSADRKFFEVVRHVSGVGKHERYNIVSIATKMGGNEDTPEVIAYGIPSRDLAEAACEAMNNARSKKK